MKYINKEQICSVRVELNKLNNDFIWQNEISIFGIRFRKKGFINRWDKYGGRSDIWTASEIKNHDKRQNYIINESVFFLPHLILFTSNDTSHTIYFKSVDELFKYLELERIDKWIAIDNNSKLA